MWLLKFLLKNLWLGLSYVMLSLTIGENHPFTLVPMYNNFPNYAYSYYLSDGRGTLLPLAGYFKYDIGNLSHNFNAICQDKNIPHGFQMETEEQLREVGEAMISQVMEHRFARLPGDTLQLHRICYFMQGDTIAQKDVVMYETVVNQ